MVDFTFDEVKKYCTAHSEAELVGLGATMETVSGEPVWEMHSMGLRIAGRSAVEEFYRRILGPMIRKTTGIQLRHIAYGPNFQVSERLFEVTRDDGAIVQSHGVVYLEVADDGRIQSERFYVFGAMADEFAAALGPSFSDVPGVTRF